MGAAFFYAEVVGVVESIATQEERVDVVRPMGMRSMMAAMMPSSLFWEVTQKPKLSRGKGRLGILLPQCT